MAEDDIANVSEEEMRRLTRERLLDFKDMESTTQETKWQLISPSRLPQLLKGRKMDDEDALVFHECPKLVDET